MTTKTIGDLGEEAAEQFLSEKNYAILTRRYRYKNGEIDIVARDKNVLVFVEVKTARVHENEPHAFGEPETWLTPRKAKFLKQCGAHYLMKHGINGVDCRFDLITVRLNGEKKDIRHYPNAFWM